MGILQQNNNNKKNLIPVYNYPLVVDMNGIY